MFPVYKVLSRCWNLRQTTTQANKTISAIDKKVTEVDDGKDFYWARKVKCTYNNAW